MPAMDGGEVYELFQCNDCERDRIAEAEALEHEVSDTVPVMEEAEFLRKVKKLRAKLRV